MAALEAGEEPDWEAARRYIDAVVLDEIEDDLVEMCGVDTETDRSERWVETIKARLREDLERFRNDIQTDRDQIQRWELGPIRIFVSAGEWGDESDTDKGHGWLCRLVDSGALAAAGFTRVRKADL